MITVPNCILVLATTTTGLMAGLFSAWSYAVIPGLARLRDAEYLAAIQAMNRAILNPLFFLCFLGTAVLLPLSVYLQYRTQFSARCWLLLVATVVYLAGVMGVTMMGNVPLNEALDAFPLSSASASEMAAHRSAFELPWNKLNTLRTVASLLAFVLVIIACLTPVEKEV